VLRVGEDRPLRKRTRIRVGILGVAAAGLIACGLPGVASAQEVVTVNTIVDVTPPNGCAEPPAGDCSLREAIEQSEATEIVVPVDDYVLMIGGDIVVDRPITIRGAGAGLPTIRPYIEFPNRVLSVIAEGVTVRRVRVQEGNGVSNSQISSGLGGGIFVGVDGSLTVEDSEIAGNEAQSGGGIWAVGSLTLVRSTVAANLAEGDGSLDPGRGGGVGLAAGTGQAALTNVTLSGNEALGDGGGIFTQRSMSLTNVSIVGNEAPSRGSPQDPSNGAGLYQEFTGGEVTTARNVLMALNVTEACGGTATFPIDSDNGLVDEPLPTTTCNAVGDGNLIVADAMVGSLAANGGLTRTHALLAGSPAINAGALCPAADQRGVARVGVCDIGAFEYVPPASSPPPPSPSPPGDETPPPQEEELPPPVAGESVNALPARGTVRIRLPGTKRFVVLEEGQQIPVGTVVDATKGRVRLVAAANRSGGTASAAFYDGIFRIGQTKGARPITTLTLVEKLSCGRGKASAAAKKTRKRRLWGNGKGRFRTRGKYSAATVRGTKWLTEDRCDSTLTRVRQGRVAVRDFVEHRTVIVRAGKKYVAKRAR